MDRFKVAGLYLVTSQSLSKGHTTLEIVRCAVLAGVKLIQLREKDMPLREYVDLARAVRELTRPYDCLMIVNDRVDVALAVEADGVHLGQSDLPISAARAIGPDLIIGASSHNIDEAVAAQAEGASYVNIGPIFPTQTKEWNDDYLGLDGLREIAVHVKIPFTVMGGIKKEHIAELCSAGAQTIALVTAVTAAINPERAARELLEEIQCHRLS
jgi:thiamine-phosphate pyrophosphorylase